MTASIEELQPGMRVALTQQIPQRERVWTTRVTGEVVGCEQRKTGSWYAHSKDDKLWLDRLTIKKDDGEVVVCNIDEFTHIDVLPGQAESKTESGNGDGDGNGDGHDQAG